LSRVDPATLGWVKTEIDQTLASARGALADYAPGRDLTPLRLYASHLHQVAGTLQMVELDGAALLAREAESLADAIVRGSNGSESGSRLLDTVLTRLSGYLEKLKRGMPDLPMQNVAVLNQLREARGEAPLDAFHLFNPDLNAIPAHHEAQKIADTEYADRARQLRRDYQNRLLGWLRAADRDVLATMQQITDQLLSISRFAAASQLWWVAGAYIDLLLNTNLAANDPRKRPLAQLDQQIRKLVEGGEATLVRDPPEELVRRMLYEIGTSEYSSARLDEIRGAFELDLILTGESADSRHDMSRLPSIKVLHELNEKTRSHLLTAQSRLTEYFAKDGGYPRTLLSVIENITAVSAAAKKAGVGGVSDLADEVSNVCLAVKEGKSIDVDSASLQLAAAVLFMEETLKSDEEPGYDWNDQIEERITRLRGLYATPVDLEQFSAEGGEIAEETLRESDFKRLLGAVASEAYINLRKSEEALEAFAINPVNTDALAQVPPYLDQVQGALRILGQHRAADLLVVANDNLTKLPNGDMQPTAEIVDALAVATGTVEAFIRGLEQDRPNIVQMIDRAMADLENAMADRNVGIRDPQALMKSLNDDLVAWLEDNGNYHSFRGLRQRLRDVSAVAHRRNKPKPRQIATEMNNLLDIVTEDPSFLSPEVETTLVRSLQALGGLVGDLVDPSQPATAATPAPLYTPSEPQPSGFASNDSDLQTEILGVFMEEGAECVANMDRCYATWRTDHHNHQALTELRRQFHTMKGSGRIAEAGPIAELAWIVEDVLNRLISNKIALSDALYEFISDAKQKIRELIENDLAGSDGIDLDAWQARALELTERDADESESTSRAPETSLGIDETVLRIFSQEAVSHLSALSEQVDACRREGRCSVSRETERAVHTLRGNSRSLHLVEMSDAYSALDTLLETITSGNYALEKEDLNILDEIAELTAKTLDALGLQRRFPDAIRQDFDRLKSRIVSRNAEPRTEGDAPGELSAGHELEDQISSLEQLLPEDIEDELEQAETPATAVDDDSLDLQDIFCEEAQDILTRISASLEQWRAGNAGKGTVEALKRDLHTLKGSARAAGASSIGDLSHNTESLLEHLRDRGELVNDELRKLLEEVHDSLADLVHHMERRQPQPSVDELNQRLVSIDARLAAGGAVPAPVTVEKTEKAVPAARPETLPDTSKPSEPLRSSMPGAGKSEEVPDAREFKPDDVPPVARTDHSQGDEAAGAVETPEPATGGDVRVPEVHMPEMPEDRPAHRGSGLQLVSTPVPVPGQPVTAALPEAPAEIEQLEPAALAAAVGDDSASRDSGRDPRSQVRVKAQVLNKLMNYAGEVSIARSQLQEQLAGFRQNLTELRANAARFNEQIRELEIQADAQIRARAVERETQEVPDLNFDPLEFDRYTRLQQLSRSLSESLDDLSTIQLGLSQFANRTELVLRQQAHLSVELQDGLMSTRLVPFSTVVPRLRHEVRQLSRELNKDAELYVEGAEVEVDRNILDSMSEAFAHMIRNALDHGIERSERRAELKKSRTGRIRIVCRQEGGEIVLRFSDDGAGLDLDRIRDRAIQNGLIKRDSQLSDQELTQLILLSGFSTADRVTKLSGRGIGMDVVHNAVRRLGGTMTVETQRGAGTSFLLHLPISLSITQALFVRCGAQEFAIALNVIQTILKVEPEKFGGLSKDGEPLFERDGQVYPLLDLPRRLGVESGLSETKRVPILMVRMGAREVAVKVDELIGTQEVVVKNLGTHLETLDGIAGATIRGDGSVALILDLAELWLAQEHRPRLVGADEEAATKSAPVIMIVDDSLTVRKVTSRSLSRYGIEVLMAKDGVDAMEQIRKTVPDLMLVDIEMPRMDGYELTTRVRSDPETRDIPIIIITSRSGAKHRERAMQLGANAYLSKPYQEEDLIGHIKQLLARTPANFPALH